MNKSRVFLAHVTDIQAQLRILGQSLQAIIEGIKVRVCLMFPEISIRINVEICQVLVGSLAEFVLGHASGVVWYRARYLTLNDRFGRSFRLRSVPIAANRVGVDRGE